MIYPFFEYYRDDNHEYAPKDFGFTQDIDYRGEFKASEGILFLGYGISDRFALEMEAAVIEAELKKSPNDTSGVPAEIDESGIGDVEGQLRWRWNKETSSRPEFFSYFETVAPTQDEGSLIGTTDWEFKLGTGLIRGLSWGTLTARMAIEYVNSESKVELGEMAVEYLKRLSPKWRVFTGFEGTQDEVEFLTEAQWRLSRSTFIKLNNAFGVTSKATDWAPEVGILFSF
jgi:hypothetical protein